MEVLIPDLTKFKPLDWHLDVLRQFDSRQKKFLLLNCHRRSRKTTLAINILIKEAFENPRSVYLYLAPTYKQAKSIAWLDPQMLFHYLHPDIVRKRNESELYVELINGSIITLKGCDDPDSIRGIDCKGAVLDEFSLHKNELIWSEILRPIITQSADRWGMFLFTPKGRNFSYKFFNSARTGAEGWEDWGALTLSVDDTGLIPEEELRKAQIQMPESLYRQEFFCEFIADDEYTLIRWEDLDKLRKHVVTLKDKRRIVGMDPSEGGDECVMYCLEGGKIIDQEIIRGERDQNRIVGRALMFGGSNQTNSYAIDSIGIGSGICAGVEAAGKEVFRVNSAQKSSFPEKFANRRAEMWWYVWEQIKNFNIPHPGDNDLLLQQLTAPKYNINRSGKIMMELKDKTRETLGSSPDRADAFVYGLWGLQHVKTDEVKRAIRVRNNPNRKKVYAGGAGGW